MTKNRFKAKNRSIHFSHIRETIGALTNPYSLDFDEVAAYEDLFERSCLKISEILLQLSMSLSVKNRKNSLNKGSSSSKKTGQPTMTKSSTKSSQQKIHKFLAQQDQPKEEKSFMYSSIYQTLDKESDEINKSGLSRAKSLKRMPRSSNNSLIFSCINEVYDGLKESVRTNMKGVFLHRMDIELPGKCESKNQKSHKNDSF